MMKSIDNDDINDNDKDGDDDKYLPSSFLSSFFWWLVM